MKYKLTTICCVFDGDNVLMIKKLHGMKGFSDVVDGHGKDLFNFPGGKCLIDGDNVESFLDCAIRETKDETGIIPVDSKFVGQLQFVWPDDTVVLNQVFVAKKFSGALKKKSDETENMWVPVAKIPYGNMWPSDGIWVPKVLGGKSFHLKVLNPAKNPICEDLPLDFSIRVR